MRVALSVWAALSVGALGCSSCNDDQPHDADDSAVDADVHADVDRSGSDADGDDSSNRDSDHGDEAIADGDLDHDAGTDGEVDSDDDLPGPVAMELEEIPREREGMDCGPGCQQVSFAAPVWQLKYNVNGSYVLYYGDAESSTDKMLFTVDLSMMIEYGLDRCEGYWCTPPAIYQSTIAYSTAQYESDRVWTLWRYRIGESERYAIARRRMTERARPMHHFSVFEETVAWYDSAIAPAGLYAMSLMGGDVTSLTDVACVCYGEPELQGRQVVYEGWQTGFRDVWLVDIDTLDEQNLTDFGAPQFDPAFDGDWVVWADGRNDPSPSPYFDRVNPDIYGMELTDGLEEELCTHSAIQVRPDVRDGLVVWEDYRNAPDPNEHGIYDTNIDIYMLDLADRVERQVTSLPGRERMPRVVGEKVFFVAEDLLGQEAVFVVDLVEAGIIEP